MGQANADPHRATLIRVLHILTLTPLAAGLHVTASVNFVSKPQLYDYWNPPFITFVEAADPPYFHGNPTPKKLLQRAWHQHLDSGSYHTDINGNCGIGILLCYMPVREAGMYWAKARINGVEREDSVAINCATGDSLLDFVASRKRFMDAVDSSRATNPTFRNRKEFVFAIMRDPGPPAHLAVLWLSSPNANPCKSPFGPSQIDPSYGYGQVLAIVHVHPDRPGEVMDCPGRLQRDTAAEGLSDDDVRGQRDFNNFISSHYQLPPVPWYAIDLVNAYRLMPGKRKYESTKDANTFKWESGPCHWVRPSDNQAGFSN